MGFNISDLRVIAIIIQFYSENPNSVPNLINKIKYLIIRIKDYDKSVTKTWYYQRDSFKCLYKTILKANTVLQ